MSSSLKDLFYEMKSLNINKNYINLEYYEIGLLFIKDLLEFEINNNVTIDYYTIDDGTRIILEEKRITTRKLLDFDYNFIYSIGSKPRAPTK